MKLEIPSYLLRNPFPRVQWNSADKPILILDNQLFQVKNIHQKLKGEKAYIVGIDQKTIDFIFENLDAKIVQFYEMKVSNISNITKMCNIEELSISWNSKLESIKPIGKLTQLKNLVLMDTSKINDLAPLVNLKQLKMLSFSGGIITKNIANSLQPLSKIKSLEFVQLHNLRVLKNGLRPLSKLTQLKKLDVSNQFPTEEYAFLSTALTHTKCDYFSPYVKIKHPIDRRDIMVTGSRKPFLNQKLDKAKMEKYEKEFHKLREKHLK